MATHTKAGTICPNFTGGGIIKSHLHILQLEGYQPLRFLRWWVKNPFKFKLENKKPLVWTGKVKFIYFLSGGFWPLMFVALAILKPYEMINRRLVKTRVRNKIRSLKNLKVIGITGSYGKTSTKEFLYQILKQKYRVLRTPESYNTVFGIAKVVDLELDKNYDVFICEMGAYKRGEIKELCWMVEPDYGMLTGINEQHLERFGSMENIIKAKNELVDYVLSKKGQVVINSAIPPLSSPPKLGGEREGVYYYGKDVYNHPSLQNIEGAMRMAKILGVTQKPKLFLQPDHRLKVIKRGENLTIIDDAYSANVTGFEMAIKFMQKFPGYKIVVTPGITELGPQTSEIHILLGKLIDQVSDMVVLVGKNERTESLSQSLGQSKFEFVDSVGQWRQFVDPHRKTVLLFENDLPDNY